MREIEFRGKRIANGEWVYGWVYSIVPYGDPHERGYMIKEDMGDDYEVIPETVGQYTGLQDKNGRKIYEGDILRFPAETLLDEKSFIGYEVFYHDNDCADRHVGFQMNRMHFYGSLCGGECKGYMLPKYTTRMIVIGNINGESEVTP